MMNLRTLSIMPCCWSNLSSGWLKRCSGTVFDLLYNSRLGMVEDSTRKHPTHSTHQEGVCKPHLSNTTKLDLTGIHWNGITYQLVLVLACFVWFGSNISGRGRKEDPVKMMSQIKSMLTIMQISSCLNRGKFKCWRSYPHAPYLEYGVIFVIVAFLYGWENL